MRADDGEPAVIRNAPFTVDGTPMPTRYWLVDRDLVRGVARLEADGGVRAAEAEVDPDALAAAHRAYAAERDAAVPAGHAGPTPVRRRRRHPPGREVPPRALRVLARRRRRPGRRVGRRPLDSTTVGDAAPVTRPASRGVDIGTNSVRLLVADVDGTTRPTRTSTSSTGA